MGPSFETRLRPRVQAGGVDERCGGKEHVCHLARTAWLVLVSACWVVPDPHYQREDDETTSIAEPSSSSGDVRDGSATDVLEESSTGLGGSETTGPGESTDATSTGEAASSSSGGAPLVCGENDPDADGPCPAECDACVDQACVFSCATEQGCKETTLACPPGRSCVVVCGAHQACEKAVVNCSASNDCAVQCDGDQSCKDIDVNCGAGTCTLECGLGPQACEKAKLRCGTNDSSMHCSEAQPDAKIEPDELSTCACAADPACDV
jgi:hypothetical protein